VLRYFKNLNKIQQQYISDAIYDKRYLQNDVVKIYETVWWFRVVENITKELELMIEKKQIKIVHCKII